MPSSGINKRGIARMMQDIQAEFDKHEITIPIHAEETKSSSPGELTGTKIYNGPVIMGNADGARLAWGNQHVDQSVNSQEQVASGFEPIAQAVASTIAELDGVGLTEEDLTDARGVGEQVLSEVTKPEPDRGVVRRGVAALKGFLLPVAMGAAAGAGEGAHEWAKTAVEQLGVPF